jgi:flap endonuclease-1
MDYKGRVTSHLSGLLYRNIRLIEMGIRPVFVFDGEPPRFKERAIAERAAAKEEAQRRLHEAKERGEKELKTYAQATARITESIIEESKKILTLLGIPVIQAPSEGEAQAAYLSRQGLAYAVGSQDYDSLLFGAPRLVRNLTLTGKRKLPHKGIYVTVEPEMIDLNESLRKLNINRQKLIWVAIMTGTDYNPGIKGIGAKKGYAIVQKANSLQECFELAGAAEEFTEEIREIESFYLEPPVKDANGLEFGEPQKEKIIEFLCGEHDFALERIEAALEKISKKEKGGQSRLEDWF